MNRRRFLHCIGILWAVAHATSARGQAETASGKDGWVTVAPPGFQGAINNPLKGFRDYKQDDPRIFAVQMGLIGHFGEHHNPAPTADQRRLLAEAFQKAFKNKPVLVRHNDTEFMAAGFGIYYDTFANLDREPPDEPREQNRVQICDHPALRHAA